MPLRTGNAVRLSADPQSKFKGLTHYKGFTREPEVSAFEPYFSTRATDRGSQASSFRIALLEWTCRAIWRQTVVLRVLRPNEQCKHPQGTCGYTAKDWHMLSLCTLDQLLNRLPTDRQRTRWWSATASEWIVLSAIFLDVKRQSETSEKLTAEVLEVVHAANGTWIVALLLLFIKVRVFI